MSLEYRLLKAMCNRQNWDSYGLTVARTVLTNPDLKILYGFLKDLHSKVDQDLSLEDLRLFISSSISDKSRVEHLEILIEEAKKTPAVSDEVLRESVLEYIRRTAAFTAAQDLASTYNSPEFDLDQVISNLQNVSQSTIAKLPVTVYTDHSLPDFAVDRPKTCKLLLSEKLDESLGGGVAAGELALFLAGTKKGKTSILCRIGALNALAGKRVLHVTLEINDILVARRYDAALCGRNYQEMLEAPDTVQAYRNLVSKNGGEVFIVNWLHEEHCPSEILPIAQKHGPIDLLLVDYLGLMTPDNSWKLSRAEQRHILSRLTRDMRRIANKLDVPVISAWQVNREGAQSDVASIFHIAESFETVCHADVVLGISQSEPERERRELWIHTLLQRFGGTARTAVKFMEDFDRCLLEEVKDA